MCGEGKRISLKKQSLLNRWWKILMQGEKGFIAQKQVHADIFVVEPGKVSQLVVVTKPIGKISRNAPAFLSTSLKMEMIVQPHRTSPVGCEQLTLLRAVHPHG